MKQHIKPVFLLLPIFLLLFSAKVNAELNAYMSITGETQGLISGDVTLQGREDTFEVNEFHHLFQKDSAGRPTIHSLIVTTPMSKGMPILLNVFNNNEVLTSVVIRFYRPNNVGQEENYYTMTLFNARLVMIEPIMLDNKVPANQSFKTRFRMRFDYARLQHQNIDGEQAIVNGI